MHASTYPGRVFHVECYLFSLPVDSCDIVDMNSPEQALNNEQRKNLGSIAKLLQVKARKYAKKYACLESFISSAVNCVT